MDASDLPHKVEPQTKIQYFSRASFFRMIYFNQVLHCAHFPHDRRFRNRSPPPPMIRPLPSPQIGLQRTGEMRRQTELHHPAAAAAEGATLLSNLMTHVVHPVGNALATAVQVPRGGGGPRRCQP